MPKNRTLRLLFLFLFAFSVVTTVGCQGCRDDKAQTAEEKKKEEERKKKEAEEKDKPNFETEPAVSYPGQYKDAVKNNRTKRGHWISTDYRLQANNFDVQGNMAVHSSALNAPVAVENTDYYSVSSRPFTIAKGEQKSLSTNVFIPRRDKGTSAFITYNLQRNSGVVMPDFHGVRLMKPFQYHMVVLTKEADKYAYMNVIDSVAVPTTVESFTRLPVFYAVVRTRPDEEPITLPRQALYWTTIAYVVWDDLDVDQLDAEQQQALIDWVHFGGQLILSGPDSLDKLANSFLADYLPAKIKSSRNLTADDFAEINAYWEVKDSNQKLTRKIVVNDESPIIGVDFELHPDAKFVNDTGEIVVERPLGRGRIVATSFSLKSKPIINWPSYQSFFNSAILRRPARRFGTTSDSTFSFAWLDDATSIFDPLIGSTLRFLSRDLVHSESGLTNPGNGTPQTANVSSQMVTGFATDNSNYSQYNDNLFRTTNANSKEIRNLDDHWHYGGFTYDEQSGTAGWSDESGISVAARETLRQAAGISPPSSAFVLKMLSIYLLVLVPINWLIFRSIGRVEWAWIAAPIIAIAGAMMVAKMASLDIGFVRSNTQVACLEVFGDYPRGHVAQYSALYTSLSTGYEVELDNLSAQSLPLGDPYKKWKEKEIAPVTIRQTIKKRLEGFQVQSNSTGMLHTEMMLDLNGVFSLAEEDGKLRIDNSTQINLEHAAVLRRNGKGLLEAAWLGGLSASSSTESLEFEPVESMGDPWQGSIVLQVRWMGEELWERYESAIEVMEDGGAKVRVGAIKEMTPEFSEQWSEFAMLVNRLPSDPESIAEFETIEDRRIGFNEFKQILRQLNQFEDLNVSAMFQQVIKNLTLAKGEVRLIAVTNEPVGNNVLKPVSTQTRQQTLVVVHLKRPAFAKASPDVNSIEDFTGRSNLDYDEQYDDPVEEENDLERDEEG